jgi:hypothetical protein
VSAPNASLYTIDDASAAVTTLTLAAPHTAQTLTVSLIVGDGSDSSSANVSLVHEPQVVIMYIDLGPLTSSPLTL